MTVPVPDIGGKNMLISTFIAALCIAAVAAEGELQVLHSTDSLHFHGHERLSQDTLKEVLSASLGFTIEKSSDWKGLRILDPFQYSEAVAVLVVDGVKNLDSKLPHIHRYPLTTTEHEEDTWQSLRSRIDARFPHKVHNNSVYRVDLQDIVTGGQSPLLDGVRIAQDAQEYKYLDVDVEEDAQLLKEVQVLRALAHKIETLGIAHDGLPDLYWIVLRGLHAVSDRHGATSLATIEAKQLVSEAGNALSQAFSNVYDGRVVFATVATDSSHTRRARSLLQDSSADTPVTIDDPTAYSDDYPVIFNIILWFSVVLIFALIAISVAIADMDPGRDSIIYRMTSTRMKKDN
ncbi:ATPase H(+)-transporting accessory protein 2 [Frankliniella occidentalis]|uniref:ATPase H(+)-transporting accessory protein 2 n=1 Tax=Frankliniella occidentalis TaxID=133901 RepID=A0A6J1SMQ5_FRAOC|nr:ATPase H(+)-transporting accessory protein 2 [Frankliniella occidentalis]